MSTFNSKHNRAVWFDMPVVDLDRAKLFYEGVLALTVHIQTFGKATFGVLDHHDGNGGCLIIRPDEVASDSGVLLYLNVDGRIRDAASRVEKLGGQIIQPVHSIGEHGHRTVIRDSEGNRLALHSNTDA